MTSNTTEYQREYQRQYRKTHPQKQYKKSKVKKAEVKKVKNKMLEIALERLKPPRAPIEQELMDEPSHDIGLTEIPDWMRKKEVKVETDRDSLKVGLQVVGKHPIDKTGVEGSNPSHASKTIDFNNLDPGYQKWALSLETQRHYYYTKFGKVHRKDRIEVKKDLRIKNQELDMVELMKKEKISLYRECMNEMKTVLEKRKK